MPVQRVDLLLGDVGRTLVEDDLAELHPDDPVGVTERQVGLVQHGQDRQAVAVGEVAFDKRPADVTQEEIDGLYSHLHEA